MVEIPRGTFSSGIEINQSRQYKKIRDELVRKITVKKCFNIGNRAEAIKKAIINSEPNEIVLIAGKGHEDQKIYKNKILYISDKLIIKNLKLRLKI